MKNNIPKLLRVVMFLAALTWIVAMWVKKDIAATLAAVPAEAAVPVIVTSLCVALLKVGFYTGVILLIKWLAGKLGGSKK